jgi:hypothetical protein
MTVKDPNTGKKGVSRIPLELDENGVKRPVATVPEAIAAQIKLKVQRAENALPMLGQKPKFCDYAVVFGKVIAAVFFVSLTQVCDHSVTQL